MISFHENTINLLFGIITESSKEEKVPGDGCGVCPILSCESNLSMKLCSCGKIDNWTTMHKDQRPKNEQ